MDFFLGGGGVFLGAISVGRRPFQYLWEDTLLRRTISVWRLARTRGTNRQTNRQTDILLLYYKVVQFLWPLNICSLTDYVRLSNRDFLYNFLLMDDVIIVYNNIYFDFINQQYCYNYILLIRKCVLKMKWYSYLSHRIIISFSRLNSSPKKSYRDRWKECFTLSQFKIRLERKLITKRKGKRKKERLIGS